MSQQDSERPLVSVIMPVRNAAAILPLQLEALSRQTYGGSWELLVVDNGSTDESAAVARLWSDRIPMLRVISAAERAGINYARNAGAHAARAEFLLFCDADDEVDDNWLKAMVEAAEECDLVGGRLDDNSLNNADVRTWRGELPTERLPTALGFLPYAVGANCGLRADILRELGGFDERHAVGGEDVELFWRAQLASYRLCFVPTAIVHYRYREDLATLARQFYRYGRAEPQLYRTFARWGVQRSSVRQALRNWAWILRHVPDFFGDSRRKGIWIRKASYRFGRLVGSFTFRTFYP